MKLVITVKFLFFDIDIDYSFMIFYLLKSYIFALYFNKNIVIN